MKVKANTFEKIELGAGLLLNKFTNYASIADEDIICATRNGGTLNVPASLRNISVDGIRTNTVESYVNDGWTPTLAFTALTSTPEMVQMALGIADIDPDTKKVIPKHIADSKYFKDVYWVGERSDGAIIVFYIGKALSTGGLSWKRNDKGESESSITLTGNYTAADQDTAPFWMQEIAPVPTQA